MTRGWFVAAALGGALVAPPFARHATTAAQSDRGTIATADHYVKVTSQVPAMTGQIAQVYVRERALPSTLEPGVNLLNRVVLFVHGAGTPAEVAFDVPYADYSWMAALAQGGFDVFAMDVSGYGRSTRPWPMNDPCNLSAAQQATFGQLLAPAPCPASYGYEATTIGSDWHDIDAVVDHLRALRHVARVTLVGWSLGGPRAGGYASQHPDKVSKLVLLSPAYSRNGASTPPASTAPVSRPGIVDLQQPLATPAARAAFNTQSRSEFDANWDRQVGCPNQFEMPARESVWSAMLASDPVGATWGTGVRRAPQTTTWGWNKDAAAKVTMPLLLFSPQHDAQVAPATVRALYEDAASPQKTLVDLACTSHNALWERNHGLLFAATREWLEKGTVSGTKDGVVKLGY